ncbi:hypothetical protein B1H58_20395 (plasmid) [Pantoea alhagi]|uniref:Uncharacterized protein n=1 Tax=Pantoea alhagi TaxID=1891675 RepID=A0A1W6BBH0_9GAMM|nr:hypothetical protein [Pantoea alhagi]ARJ44383.1 hypothetical protein B1H58_20395 [Pantoea alhagi]
MIYNQKNNNQMNNFNSDEFVLGPEVSSEGPAKVLLVGMGADIGSNIIYLSATRGIKYPVTDILTHAIVSEGVGANNRSSLDELKARLILANPSLYDKVKINQESSSIIINGHNFRIHFRDFDSDLEDLGKFDLAILATSRRHIRSRSHLEKLEYIAKVVIGVAENSDLPALYPALLSADASHFLATQSAIGSELTGSFAMGSCQCVGWTTGLRVLADYCSDNGVLLQDVLLHTEVDIVHPDTASSNFGTNRTGSRTEDPRDNLRPGVSQVATSMQRFKPATSVNTVSLRVLTQPPGYQIQRFFLKNLNVNIDKLIHVARRIESEEPSLIHVTSNPIGSKAYASMPCGLVLIATEQHISAKSIGDITEVTLQAYVHNTLGYSAAILATTDRILNGESLTIVN